LIDPSHGSSLGFRLIEDNYRDLAKPGTSHWYLAGRIVFWVRPKLFELFPIVFNFIQHTFSSGVENFKGGFAHTASPNHGLGLGDLILQTQIRENFQSRFHLPDSTLTILVDFVWNTEHYPR